MPNDWSLVDDPHDVRLIRAKVAVLVTGALPGFVLDWIHDTEGSFEDL